MSYDLSPLSILGTGIDQAVMHGAPADMIARLRGAHAYCQQTGAVLRDETLAARRKTASAPVIETIPAAMAASEVE